MNLDGSECTSALRDLRFNRNPYIIRFNISKAYIPRARTNCDSTEADSRCTW